MPILIVWNEISASESIPSKELPRIINLRLIPLKDAIVYDVFMEKYSVYG